MRCFTYDIVSRLVAQKLSEAWGKQVIVENRAGGNGFIGSEYAMKQPPDGYTILVSIASTHATAQFLFPKLPYTGPKRPNQHEGKSGSDPEFMR